MQTNEKHPLLAGLVALWNYPEEMLNSVLWAFEDGDKKTIGYADEYVDYMEAVCNTNNPAEAWGRWCVSKYIEHEIDNNPFL